MKTCCTKRLLCALLISVSSVSAAPKEEYVLQTAANSVVGKQIIALARHWGVKTINVVRRESAVAELEALG